MVIFGAAVRLVTTLVIEAAIRQVTFFLTAVLPVVNMSSALMDVVVSPAVRLTILNVVSLKRIVRNVIEGIVRWRFLKCFFCGCAEILSWVKNEAVVSIINS